MEMSRQRFIIPPLLSRSVAAGMIAWLRARGIHSPLRSRGLKPPKRTKFLSPGYRSGVIFSLLCLVCSSTSMAVTRPELSLNQVRHPFEHTAILPSAAQGDGPIILVPSELRGRHRPKFTTQETLAALGMVTVPAVVSAIGPAIARKPGLAMGAGIMGAFNSVITISSLVTNKDNKQGLYNGMAASALVSGLILAAFSTRHRWLGFGGGLLFGGITSAVSYASGYTIANL